MKIICMNFFSSISFEIKSLVEFVCIEISLEDAVMKKFQILKRKNNFKVDGEEKYLKT